MDNNDLGREQSAPRDGAPTASDGRLPYEAPRLRTGEAFEKAMMASGCNSSLACPIPCF